VDSERDTRERWRRVEEIFEQTLELAEAEQAPYLERACAGDAEVRREVDELLGAHRAAGEDFLDRAAPEKAAAVLGTGPGRAATAVAPERVGIWRLLSLLGEGGMGRVYLAERADGQFEQRAAVKLLKPALAERGAIARFLRERQILARLDHPGIARLLDGGLAEDGTPYFVLEHVEGEPITSWCERHDASLEERIRLHLAVCAAVAAAHRLLVVHRDLKPSNILVGADGAPKLLDFGIAKPLEQPGETRTFERALTPEYAAPEQVAGGAITTATDVYALGGLLYELLVGRVPHPWRDGQSLFDFQQRVVSEEPERPSAAVAAAARAVAGAARAQLAARARRLAGDLDAIVTKALRKEPGERYSSVEALAGDLERYLSGRPVAARGGAASYRVRKFVLRHRLGLAAAALVAVSLAGGGVATVWQAQRARAEAAKSQGIADFLINLFTAQDPYQAKGEERTARQLLDLGARQVEAELADQPEVQAAIYHEIGAVYLQLGDFKAAEPMVRKLLALQEKLHGPASAEAVDARIFIGNVLTQLGRYPEAEALYRQAEADETADRGGDTRLVGEALRGLAEVLSALSRWEEAESAERRALAILRAAMGETDNTTLRVMNNLSLVLGARGKLDESERVQREHLALLERKYGKASADSLIPRYNLGCTLADRGHYAEAEKIFREVLPVGRKVLGPRHPVVVLMLRRMARTLDTLGRGAEAEPLVAESTAIVEAVDNPDQAALQHLFLAVHGLLIGDARRAEPEARAAYDFYRAKFGDANDMTAWALGTLARAHAAAGRLMEARGEIEAALATDYRLLGFENQKTLYFESERARILLDLGDRAEAARVLERTASAQRRVLGADHLDLARTLAAWASALDPVTEAGRRAVLLEEVLAIARRALPPGHPWLGELAAGRDG